MTHLMHMRGDLPAMFLFFVFFFLGLWQVVVAWKRLNGLSLTGRPDRRAVSYAVGAAIAAASCAWYFSGMGHFASPDLEGAETLLVMSGGLVVATLIQGALAQMAFVMRRSLGSGSSRPDRARSCGEELSVELPGASVPGTFFRRGEPRAVGGAVLLLHDYGGTRADAARLAEAFANRGYDTLTVDLDGHGLNPRGVGDPAMRELLDGALEELKTRSRNTRTDAVGAGLGGLLAIELASRGAVRSAVAIDPPARDARGHHDVDAFRECSLASVLAEAARPAARAEGGKRIGLSRLIASLPAPRFAAGQEAVVTVLGTCRTWLNNPASLAAFTREHGLSAPVQVEGTHGSLVRREDTAEAVARVLA